MEEAPEMRKLAESMKNRPFTIFGVNTDEGSRSALAKRAKEHGMTWPMVYEGPSSESKIAKLWNVRSYPTLIVIDAAGKIRYRGSKLSEAKDVVTRLVRELERFVKKKAAK